MAETTFTQAHGKYYHAAKNDRIYTGASASAGIALIVPATTGNHPSLWNPSDSGRNVSIIRLELSYVSGNNAPGAIEWASVATAGTNIGTGAPVVTFTKVAPVGLLGGALDHKARWAPTVNTYVAAPVFLRPTGLSLLTGVAATAVAPFTMVAEYDGDFVVAPGNVICLCTQAATSTALFQVAVTWEEIDVTTV